MTDDRTFGAIEPSDLQEIRQRACLELERFLERVGQPPGKYNRYRSRLICVCLVQGAAQHFVDVHANTSIDRETEVSHAEIVEKGYRVVDGRVISGVKDIDVFFFFNHDPKTSIPYRKHANKIEVFKFSRLGERKLDFMKKGVAADVVEGTGDLKGFVRSYLQKTSHGRRYLAKKSIIGLSPESVFAQPLWATQRVAL